MTAPRSVPPTAAEYRDVYARGQQAAARAERHSLVCTALVVFVVSFVVALLVLTVTT